MSRTRVERERWAGILRLTPPLPKLTDTAASSPSVCRALRITYDRLAAVSGGSTGPRAEWQLLEAVWFHGFVQAYHENRFSTPDIELEESQLPQPAFAFVAWLSARIVAGRADEREFYLGLHAFDHSLRRKKVFSFLRPGKVDLEFFDHRKIASELRKIIDGHYLPRLDPLLISLVQYAHFTAVHPMMDGNGRGSRQMLKSLLQGLNLWNELPLPIGFLIHRDRANYIQHIRSAIVSGNWAPYFQYMLKTMSAACELSAIVRYVHHEKY